MELFDIAIVGAGAAGLAAAVSAAKEGARVCLAEGSAKPGKKLLATGNGRCNISNLAAGPANYFADPLPQEFFDRFSPQKLLDFFAACGLRCTPDEEGRLYPAARQAAAVVQVLYGCAQEYGVQLQTDFAVARLQKQDGIFTLYGTQNQIITARQCILACGGKAAPKLGCGQTGYCLATGLGHTCTPLLPALTRLSCPDPFPAAVSGMRSACSVTLLLPDGAQTRQTGEVIFSRGNVSGICVMQLSQAAAQHFAASQKSLQLLFDFLPDMSFGEFSAYLRALQKNRPTLPGAQLLGGIINMQIGRELMKRTGLPSDVPVFSLKKADLHLVQQTVKNFSLPINGVAGFEEAQVTAGGIPLKEIDLADMRSRLCKGLYLVGEMLNVHGDCGGFNLHFAFSSGICAGKSAAAAIKNKTN